MTFSTDTEADILAISFQTGGNYGGGEMLSDAGVILEYDTNAYVMRIEVLRYQSKMPALMPFLTALVGMEASGGSAFKREDIIRFLNYSQLVPVPFWFSPQQVAAQR